ncbi:hypothetical protein CHS0354_028464 [Potamilus streckersoni]|uniref:Uncharacterized protein n=1 Tax=Potamilus streckersoni TaxID=2493646 RepID=A0AAE0SBG1_9BIVA|nr:hypothetical protein CHS0354_028464 [Potamilus streckersoni]
MCPLPAYPWTDKDFYSSYADIFTSTSLLILIIHLSVPRSATSGPSIESSETSTNVILVSPAAIFVKTQEEVSDVHVQPDMFWTTMLVLAKRFRPPNPQAAPETSTTCCIDF